jgi:hypothetical protein
VSVPPEVIQRLTAGGGAPSAGPSAAAGGTAPMQGAGGMPSQTPSAAPNAQPAEKRGLRAAAMSNLSIAQNMLEQALTVFSPEDKEYKAVIKCLNTLSGLVAKNDSSDLVPAQVMRMVGQMPQMGGGSDVQRMILQQMKHGQQPPGGGAPM